MCVLAIDLGGSHIGCGVARNGQVLISSSIETDARSLRDLLSSIKQRLTEHCHSVGITPSSCQGIGIGFPAIVDAQNNELLSTFMKFDDVTGSDLVEWANTEFGIPLKIENDAKLALLGEHAAGAAVGFEDVAMITLGTGIGVAAMLQNRLLHSRLGQAGQLGGHITVNWNGRVCACGAIGCAEVEASTSVLPQIARSWPGFAQSSLSQESVIDFGALFRNKDAGDRVAAKILEHCIGVWSALAVSLIHAYGPEIILFGGGVLQRHLEILPAIRTYVNLHGWKTTRGLPRIEVSALGGSAALIGAASLFSEEKQ